MACAACCVQGHLYRRCLRLSFLSADAGLLIETGFDPEAIGVLVCVLGPPAFVRVDQVRPARPNFNQRLLSFGEPLWNLVLQYSWSKSTISTEFCLSPSIEIHMFSAESNESECVGLDSGKCVLTLFDLGSLLFGAGFSCRTPKSETTLTIGKNLMNIFLGVRTKHVMGCSHFVVAVPTEQF